MYPLLLNVNGFVAGAEGLTWVPRAGLFLPSPATFTLGSKMSLGDENNFTEQTRFGRAEELCITARTAIYQAPFPPSSTPVRLLYMTIQGPSPAGSLVRPQAQGGSKKCLPQDPPCGNSMVSFRVLK